MWLVARVSVPVCSPTITSWLTIGGNVSPWRSSSRLNFSPRRTAFCRSRTLCRMARLPTAWAASPSASASVVAGFHQAAQHFHQLQHGDIAQPVAEHRHLQNSCVHFVGQIGPLAKLPHDEHRRDDQPQHDPSHSSSSNAPTAINSLRDERQRHVRLVVRLFEHRNDVRQQKRDDRGAHHHQQHRVGHLANDFGPQPLRLLRDAGRSS